MGGVCRNFSGPRGRYAGTVVRSGQVGRNFWGLKGGGMPELLLAHGWVRRNFWGLREGYARIFEGSGGVCRNFSGLGGGYAGTFVGSGRAMPELLWA